MCKARDDKRRLILYYIIYDISDGSFEGLRNLRKFVFLAVWQISIQKGTILGCEFRL